MTALLCATSLAAVGVCPAPAGAKSTARVFRMVRKDMRITLSVRGDRIVRTKIRALEHCGHGASAASGFLKIDLPRSEAIAIRPNGSFHYGATFDDARGNATFVLDGDVRHRSVVGFFRFHNREDTTCGTGRPHHRNLDFRAKLTN